jgi:hypothetical protein
MQRIVLTAHTVLAAAERIRLPAGTVGDEIFGSDPGLWMKQVLQLGQVAP